MKRRQTAGGRKDKEADGRSRRRERQGADGRSRRQE
jgi:hypothetical protein